MTSPIVKWVGGKRRIADQILATFPSAPSRRSPGPWRYVEPFCGGASVYLRARELGHRFEGAFLSDACAPLIGTYRAIVSDPGEVETELRIAEQTGYITIRDCFNMKGRYNEAERAAMFLYLNRRGFNGLYRVNASDKFNVPVGNDARALHSLVDLESFRDAMSDVTLGAHVYQNTWTVAESSPININRPTIVYCDPPYVPIKPGSFVGYNANGFDHQAFAHWAHDLAARGVCVRVSNSDAPRTRELYRGFTVVEIDNVKRSVGASARSRAPVKELLLCAN